MLHRHLAANNISQQSVQNAEAAAETLQIRSDLRSLTWHYQQLARMNAVYEVGVHIADAMTRRYSIHSA